MKRVYIAGAIQGKDIIETLDNIRIAVELEKEEKYFIKFANAYKLAIKQLIKKGKFKDFKDENEVFDWWIKGISKRKYFELKQQTKIDYNE